MTTLPQDLENLILGFLETIQIGKHVFSTWKHFITTLRGIKSKYCGGEPVSSEHFKFLVEAFQRFGRSMEGVEQILVYENDIRWGPSPRYHPYGPPYGQKHKGLWTDTYYPTVFVAKMKKTDFEYRHGAANTERMLYMSVFKKQNYVKQ